jgi:hypothetical protein
LLDNYLTVHILLMHWAKDGSVICNVQPENNDSFVVQFEDGVYKRIIREAEKELDFYLIELQEPNPWKYAKYHCSTASNLYSMVRWVLII